MARDPNKSKAAYTLVDISELPAEIRQEVLEDAMAGGGEYGLRVVEEVHNGAARAQIFGYYHTDQEKWDAAKDDLGISGSETEDSSVSGESAGDDLREQAMLRQAAEQRAAAEADAVRTAEMAAVQEILDAPSNAPANQANRTEPNSNIVDATASVSKHERPANKAKGK